MYFHFIVLFCYVSLIRTIEISKYSSYQDIILYLEENDSLVGEKTPMIIADCHIFGYNVSYSRFSFNEVIRKSEQRPHIFPLPHSRLTNKNKRRKNYRRDIMQSNFNVVYVETLIVIDFQTFRFFDKNLTMIANYMTTFWNAVDLKFRKMKNPKIRINIAGIVIPMKRLCLPFFKKIDEDPNFLDVPKTLNELVDYFYGRNFKIPGISIQYDVVIGMTRQKFSNLTMNNNAVIGVAKTKSICTKYSAALVIDEGDFSGITTAAHELGHVLGVEDHDPYGSKKCIMSSTAGGNCWSGRSTNILQKFASNYASKCLWNYPDVGKPLQKFLPGKFMSREKKCKKFNKDVTAYKGALSEFYNCNELYCTEFKNQILTRHPLGDILEGSECGRGQGKICLNGHCLEDPDPSVKKVPPPIAATLDQQCRRYGYKKLVGGLNDYGRKNFCKNLTCMPTEFMPAQRIATFLPEPPEEGTSCGYGKICRDQNCVVDRTIMRGLALPNMMTLNEMCKKLDPTYYTHESFTTTCKYFKCNDKNSTWTFYFPPEDGTLCGTGRMCSEGNCLTYEDLFKSIN